MYLGSVKFFKHLIYLVIILLFFAPIVVSIYLFIQNQQYKKEAQTMLQTLDETTNTLASEVASEPTLEDFAAYIAEEEISTNDILDALNSHDINIEEELVLSDYFTIAEQEHYATLYPELYATPPTEFIVEENTIYFTFDDGPSDMTLSILSILEKQDVKATFFVTQGSGENSAKILQQIVEDGHTLAVHTYSHDYDVIYESVDAYLEDFNAIYNFIYESTGVKAEIFRFAGGSINNHNQHIYRQIIAEMTRRGFVYYDWNVSGEDAAEDASWTSIYRTTLEGIGDKSRAIVLLHDAAWSYNTVVTLEDLIINLKEKGYNIKPLNNDIKPIVFGYVE